MDDTATQNPLLHIESRIPFDQIRAEHIEPAVRELLELARTSIQAIVDLSAPRTFENTMVALDEAAEGLSYAMTIASHLESVCSTPEIRKAYAAVKPEVSKFYSSITFNTGLWNALKVYAQTDEARALTGPRKRYLEKTISSFQREGADLPPEQKARLSDIDVELSKLTLRFSQNVVDSSDAWEMFIEDRDELAGLPDSAIDAARESALAKNKTGYRFTLQAPSYLPVMTYLDDAGVREKLYRAFATRATQPERDNRPLVAKILELRRERASLLGFANFADLVLVERMAKTGEGAWRFVDDLRARSVAFFARENDELHAFRKSLEGASAPPLESWDVAYYAEKLRREKYEFDEELLRPYFALENVLAGMFEIASRLYGVRITPWQDVPVWHSSVKTFEIQSAEGESIGAFYVDVFPREGKRDGAWMQGMVTALPRAGDRGPHVALLAGNVTPPTAEKPALLSHREVETMFHEFGHLLHHCLSRVELRGQAGTRVAWDFVELPSQVMENWCWEQDSLALFARHYANGENIKDQVVNKLRAARVYRSASAMMRQLAYCQIDLSLHTRFEPVRDGDATAYARNILQEFSSAKLPDEHAMVAAFTHLFASPVGYAAGYYSYKWAEVLDADVFTRFKREGLFSSDVGGQFRSRILARGDSEDPARLYRDFMGRDPDLSALLERSGLAEPAPSAP